MASNVYKKCISSTEDICTFKYDDKSPDKSYWYGGRHLGPTKSNAPWGFVMSFNAAGDVLIYEDKRKITGNGPGMWIERNGKASFVRNWSFKGTLTKADVYTIQPALRSAFNDRSLKVRKQITVNLEKLELYNASIDGLWGRNTLVALIGYNALFNKDISVESKADANRLFTQILQHKRFSYKSGKLGEDQDCSSLNPHLCSSKILCQRATRTYGSSTFWLDVLGLKNYAAEAQLRGLSCGVNQAKPKSCFNDVTFCSAEKICRNATSSRAGKVSWDSRTFFAKYVAEAKRRGLSCGVSVQVGEEAQENSCLYNPRFCTDKRVCRFATFTKASDGIKVWKINPYYQKYLVEAKSRGLSCGVTNDENTATLCSQLVAVYENFKANDANSYALETIKSKMKDANCAFKDQTVGTLTQKTCDENPAYCGAVQLCQKASTTKNGQKVWRSGKAFETYIKAAESVGLSCNVEQVEEEEEIFRVASGTGFFVSDEGHVVTNEHVIDGCTETRVHFKGEMVPAKLIADDSRNDLALLKIKEKPSAFLKLSGENPYLLQDIIAAGYPFGNKISSSIKVTRGVVSSLSGVADNISEIQIDAALQPGNSGGPLLDENGNVVGVAVAKLDAEFALEKFGTLPENTNFGIKVSVVKSLLDAHEVEYQTGRSTTMPKSKLGKLANDGTVFLSCWMTTAQYEFMKTKKAMFDSVN